jgi:DNA-binding MurR/RpiR family transcriptional regulator
MAINSTHQFNLEDTNVIINQLHSLYDGLTTTDKRIADWFLQNINDAPNFTITEIANRCNVGESTIFRFTKQFGVTGFKEFRLRLAQELAARPVITDWRAPHSDIKVADDIQTVMQKVTQANIESLFEMWERLDPQEITRTIEVLTNAKKIIIFGEGSSGVIAQDAQYRLLRVGIPAYHYTSHMAFVTASLLSEDDATIAISHSGRTREVVEAQQLANQVNAKTICLTSFPNSPLAETSDVKLVVAAHQHIFTAESIPWRIVQLTVVDILCVRLWQHFGEEYCTDRFERIDEALKVRRLF